ncbi:hypothetical protein PFHG_02634 [Plasmodium falciparum HB3]|uniref:Uncharacterized protein n=1 Tax=Plasmodium falciparum (isolate HB3) TaxID=137071 RepID=A0A0L7KCS2_PLAFX|nr:hypothetical protein PFHG_02634 [Plasmodium falciparum HB3]
MNGKRTFEYIQTCTSLIIPTRDKKIKERGGRNGNDNNNNIVYTYPCDGIPSSYNNHSVDQNHLNPHLKGTLESPVLLNVERCCYSYK